MEHRHFVAAFLAIPLMTAPVPGQTPVTASGDTVILIVKSPGGAEVTFSGTVVLRDKKTTQRLDNVKTPFELRLPAQKVDARFVADNGGGLSGEVVVFRAGDKQGQVWGTVYRGPLLLYAEPGKAFGFGDRNARERAVP